MTAHCGICGDILDLLVAATASPWSPEERAVMLARAEAAIKESERRMQDRTRIY